MKSRFCVLTFLALFAASSSAFAVTSNPKLDNRAARATTVLDQYMSDIPHAIPLSLLAQAQCVFVVPQMVKAGFVWGVKTGNGLVSCRTATGWSNPSFTHINGASFGFQIGAQVTDLVLVFMNPSAANQLSRGNFTVGGDASVAVGPVGRDAQAGTDYLLRSEIYTYSRSRGLYAGISLEGSVVNPSNSDNVSMYGSGMSAYDILTRSDRYAPAPVAEFLRRLERYAPR